MLDKIMPPRIPFLFAEEDENSNQTEQLIIGTKWSGIVLEFNKDGIKTNGYYSDNDGNKFCTIMEWTFIPWEDVDKARALAGLSPAKRKIMAISTEFEIDESVDEEYLKNLPQVNLNGRMYYFDGIRKERRPVKNPKQVFKYDSILSKTVN